MVLAILRAPDDPLCKVETRRVVKGVPYDLNAPWFGPTESTKGPFWSASLGYGDGSRFSVAAYATPGDRLWVKETWRAYVDGWKSGAEYRAGGERKNVTNFYVVDWVADSDTYANLCFSGGDRDPHHSLKWRPSIFMPRWASRLTLDVESVRVERLHAIDDAGARREGVADREAYRALWTTINGATGPKSWDGNPWVWVVGFRRGAT